MKKAVLIGALAVLGVAACGGGSTGAATTVTQTVIRETVTVPVAPETSASPATSESVAAPAAKESTAAAVPETFTMPNLIGENLQLAQDTLQSLGSFLVDQEDASGLNRLQVNDSNWKICSQTPKAGKKVPLEAVVLLASVKLTEDCP